MTERHEAATDSPRVENTAEDDPYLWLEEIDSAQVRAWVEARNRETVSALCDAQFERDKATLLEIFDAPDRIPWVQQRGQLLYNFWQDAEHRKGLWRRTTLASYRGENPDWETLLDVDLLAKSEDEDWVWRGCSTLAPEHRRGLVQLSRGGADANVIREFDLAEKRFVETGFYLAEAKGVADWVDEDTLLVSSALGGETFATVSGYARTARLYRRGARFEEAPVVFECKREDMAAWGGPDRGPRYPRTQYRRQIDFEQHEDYVEQDGAGRI
ncbi:MAG TPA: S9 family peptidase, partial [Xanthobacteraceae bacterium]|nr:S9 family peptidase [Xanthobacteraceae bacterium]